MPIQILGEMTSIGTLFAFVVVSLAVIVLRVKRPDAHRPFRVPGGSVIPVLGVLSCVYLMVSLSVMTWVRFLGWLDIGMIIYWFYGRTHSPLVDRAESGGAGPARENLANFLKMARLHAPLQRLLHHAAGVPDDLGRDQRGAGEVARARRRAQHVGMHINPEIADAFGLKILGLGAVVAVVGLPARARSKK